MPFLSPIRKRHLHVEDSREDVIVVAEKKVFCPEDLLVSNGFKKSDYYTDQPCTILNCKDLACGFGHTCKCNAHKNFGAVLKGGCFSVLKKSGNRTASCLYKSNLRIINSQRRTEVTSTDYFTFFKARTASFRESTSWNEKPTPAELEVFMLQVVIYHATNPDTLFVVTKTSFSDLRDKTEDEIEDMLEVLKKRFIEEFPNGKGINVSILGLKLFP
jgi:hypothetical protein